jgi:hypothetical protein
VDLDAHDLRLGIATSIIEESQAAGVRFTILGNELAWTIPPNATRFVLPILEFKDEIRQVLALEFRCPHCGDLLPPLPDFAETPCTDRKPPYTPPPQIE